ncbi:MAG: HAD-IIB family hydrolase [Vigna little leaf phytoplasma]|nr:HAD-IIB family hydrolase [Vigna little leaf phytoplasma]
MFFFDIDGTLYSETYATILPQTKKLILALSKKPNIILGIATGRNYRHLNVLEELFPLFKYFILCNGAITIANKSSFFENKHQLISKTPIPSEHIEHIMECIRKYQYKILPFSVGFNAEACFSNGHIENINLFKEWKKHMSKKNIVFGSINIDNSFHWNNEVFILYIFGEDRSRINFEKISEKCFNKYNWSNHIDLIAKNVNKFVGIQKIYHQYPDYELICVGDGCNDHEMLKFSDISIAMGNSKFKHIKTIADFVTPHIDENKIYDFFEQNKLV